MKFKNFQTQAALCLISSALILSGCGLGSDETITQKNVEKAYEKFSKAERAQILSLGGSEYLMSKTVNKVKKTLAADYEKHEIRLIVESAKKGRESNIQKLQAKELTPETIRSPFVNNSNEASNEFNELENQVRLLQKDKESSSASLGSATLYRGTLVCKNSKDLIDLLKASSQKSKKSVALRLDKLKNGDCSQIEHPKRYELTETVRTRIKGTPQIYLTEAGWVAGDKLRIRPSKEVGLRVSGGGNSADTSNVAYSALRPLVALSPANPTRISLAKKAIAINAEEFKEDWKAAAKRFVAEQNAFREADLKCVIAGDCQKSNEYNLRMAHYIYAEPPKAAQDGELPCEILAISDCKNVLPTKSEKR